MFQLLQLLVAQTPEPPKTGNDKLDSLLMMIYAVGGAVGGLGALVGWDKWKSRRAEGGEEPHHELITKLSERQAATANTIDEVTRNLERVDSDLRDARERLAKLEGKVGT